MNTLLSAISLLSSQQLLALLEMATTCAMLTVWALELLVGRHLSLIVRSLAGIVLALLLFWPSDSWNYLGISLELPLAAYVRGITGDLSVVTMALLWYSFFMGKKLLLPVQFKFALLIIALVLYPLALGLSMLDPYAWGYSSWIFLAIVVFFAFVAWWRRWNCLVYAIALALCAWALQWHESTNLWDYLLDPFLVGWALVSLAIYFFKLNPSRPSKA